jgi:NAD(P)-dependent dehydrogenase (short-subunit alcohol dehydrogenase family)
MKGGSIINIASISGLRGGYSPHIYCAAKFGVIGLTKTVSLELAERGIRVNAICPAGIPSAIFAGPQASTELARKTPAIVEPLLAEGVPLARAGSPDEIANAALFLASSQSAYITGQEIVVDGGLSVGVPWPIQIEIHQRYRERLQAA